MIRDILVVLDDVGQRAGPYSLWLARELDAALAAVTVSEEAAFETLAYAEVSYDVMASARAAARERAELAASSFARAARKAEVVVETSTICDTVLAAGIALLDRARLSDLVVIEQSDPDRPKPTDMHLHDLLVRSGRPTLVVPYVQNTPARFDAALVAWDGSAQAARALGDSIPFLQRASRVEVVQVSDEAAGDLDEDGRRVVAHLARHAVQAETRRLVSTIPIPETLLSHAADIGADLLVMGAYGHSRLRELILGGASRGILQSMTLPVLMSH